MDTMRNTQRNWMRYSENTKQLFVLLY